MAVIQTVTAVLMKILEKTQSATKCLLVIDSKFTWYLYYNFKKWVEQISFQVVFDSSFLKC